ncbi:MAG: hypothetical protein CMH36_03330 [Microbacterium sp.]|uniref:Lytic transglycosylase domain-containing protein n=2 Tax=Microbacteriaceae TaxID=85023 RepID=A0A3C1KHK4_9MICO|nr:hypothetical protein ASG00_01580 [Microbacterium sp. Leaf351]KQS05741.1 hypothetical protein ASF93_01650 [Microbacterium sp. Leaf347]MAL05859.1 hypothetical protein [Microbacterium sp.]MBN9197239.1 lytic transglycosylase domain-containing protein [Microbacterium ginsengisoli]ODU78643.1 MAG: hypothetical protein ABT08_03530 [Microbacterium sp. SCN 71-21]OJU77463.1 MAG: hypothetical protein BGO15_06715 [Microbacterium sp. 71-23]
MPRSAVVARRPRWSRRRAVASVFAVVAAVGFLGASLAPAGMAVASAGTDPSAASAPSSIYSITVAAAQSLSVSGDATVELDRGGYSAAAKPKVVATATSSVKSFVPPFVTPDPGTAQAIALQMLEARGMGQDQFSCLVALWNRESGWNVASYNKGSGAYGIPQALPGSKMASAGADWQTNPATQITWGLGYITGRYGTPCGAWAHSNATGWY